MKLTQLYVELDNNDITLDWFGMNEIEAFSMPGIIIVDPTQIRDNGDEKVKIAHEMGHNITGSFYNCQNPLDVFSKHERKADKWAITHLVTEDELYEAVAQGNTEMWQLSEYFDIPQQYMEKIVCYYKGREW